MKINIYFESKFKYFVYYIFPVLIIILSLVGNLLGLIVFIKKKSKLENKIGPIIIYKYLFAYGLINSYLIILLYLHGFEIYLETISKLTCQLTVYYWYATASISPMILSYISIERFISIKYPNKRLILNNTWNQHCFIIVLIVYNLIISSWIPFDYDLIEKSINLTNKNIKNYSPNNKFECLRENNNGIYLAIVNIIIIPYSLIITFTILLIISIFMSRSRVISNYTNIQNEIFKKDIKFSFNSLSINIIFIFMNLTVLIIFPFSSSFPVLYFFFVYLHLFSFSIDFYLLFIFNSLFRTEFLSFFSTSSNSNNNNNNVSLRIRNFDLNLILNLDININETNV